MSPANSLPPGFVWGAATAAFQIEGAAAEDGRTPSIWDTFCRVPGAVVGGDTGDVACDHYHRWPDDLALMSELGLDAYRFSTAWPRIVPEAGRIEQRGLDFYSRLVDGLLARGITPWVTLYHWDLPQWLEDGGGWASRDVVGHFGDLVVAVRDALGDRVRHWGTLNEPWCSAFLGYAGGQHAPGRQEPQAAVSAAHHLLLAHGTAVQALRDAPDATIGITLNTIVADPAHAHHPADAVAARLQEALGMGVFLGPTLRGAYPDDVLAALASVGTAPPVHDGDLAVIATPIDYLGVNYYSGGAVCAEDPDPATILAHDAPADRATSDPFVGLGDVQGLSRGLPRTAMGWEVQPDGLRRLLVGLQEEWTGPAGIPLYVTENGAAYADVVAADGRVPDAERAAYLRSHTAAVADAVAEGADVRGYFVWSLLDNFEWAWGYDKRFGIVRVDFDTLQRTVKDSGWAYRDLIAADRLQVRGIAVPVD